MPIEKRSFAAGMNQDLMESLLQEGMYRYALNIRNGNSEKGAVGAITNSEGNRLITYSLPSGANKVIGAFDDEANDRVIYIIYNDEGNNSILAYNYKESVINTIVADTGNVLDLNPNYLVTGIDVISGDDTSYLLFTDNWGEPKNINIDQGIRTYDTNIVPISGAITPTYAYKKYFGDFDATNPFSVGAGNVYYRNINIDNSAGGTATYRVYYRAKVTTSQDPTTSTSSNTPQSNWELCPSGYIYGVHTEESFTNIVKPHLASPTINYSTTGANYNYLEGNLYQFKVKYTKPDGRESSWSPITTFISSPTQLDSVLNIDTYNNSRLLFNAIDCYINVPDVSIYKTINVAIRRVLNDNSPSDWNLAIKIPVTDIDNYSYQGGLRLKYTFDGSKALMPLDTNESSQLMSWIPTKAQAQAITSKNRILYSNFTEGKPYTLDGERDINQNPPTLQFFERDNPYNTVNDNIDLYYYKYNIYTGIAIGGLVGEETIFNPVIVNDSAGTVVESNIGLAFKFPPTIVAGAIYSINISFDATAFEPLIGDTLKSSVSTSIDIIAPTSSITGLIDSFITEITQGSGLYLNKISNLPVKTFIADAFYESSGGDNYLIITPIEKVINVNETGWNLTVSIKKTPTASVGLNTRIKQSFKRGSQQTFGISYSDDYGRITTAIEHPALSTYNPWWKDTQASAGTTFANIGSRYAQIQLNHDAPSWATKYHILKTNSNGINNFVSFPLSRVTGLPQLSNGSNNPLDNNYFYRGFIRRDISNISSATSLTSDSIDDTELIYIPLSSLQNSLVGYTNLNESPLAYDYSQGDRIRLCYYLSSNAPHIPLSASTGWYYTSEADAEILFYDAELNAIAIRPNDLPLSLVGTGGVFAKANEAGNGGEAAIRGLLCEIYSPTREKTVDFYYEMYTGAISADTANSRYYHVGNIQTQNSAQSATIELTNGDCFVKPRTYVFRAVASALTNSSVTTTFNYFVEESNFYDKVASKTWGAGRPNRSVKSTSQEEDITGFLGEVQRPTTIRYSEPFLPDQGYNGLGTIYDLNFKDANGALKSIQKLHTEGSRVIVLHENSAGFAESDRAVVTTLDENNMTIGANTPLSDIMYYSTRAGIGTHPESFAYNNSRKYFVDVDQGQVCRLSQDGVTPISDQGMNKYFKEVFRDMINSPRQDFAYGSYDKRTEEYVLTLKWPSEIKLFGNISASVTYNMETGTATMTTSISSIDQYDLYESQSIEMSIPSIQSNRFYGYLDFTASVLDITESTVQFLIPQSFGLAVYNLFDTSEGPALLLAPFLIFPYKATTLAYSERLKSWSSFHSWIPEHMASAGLEFVSFKAGELWIHDDYSNPQKYYGIEYPAYLDLVSNQNGDQVKIWKTLGVKATTDGDVIDEADFEVAIAATDTTSSAYPIDGGVEDSSGKISTCATPAYKENQLYFDYMRTGTGTTYSDFIEGDKVRGYWQKTRLVIKEGTSKIYKIISTNFDYLMSNYTR